MSSARRRPLAAASLAVALTLALGGCGTSFDAQTNQVYQPGVGANARGDVDALNTLLVANEDGSATLSVSLQNNLERDQNLTSVSVTTLADEPLTVSTPKPVLLAAGLLTSVGTAESSTGIFTVEDATAGAYVSVTFTFSDSAPLSVEAPIVARTAEYAGVSGDEPAAPADEEATEEAATEEEAVTEESAE